MKLQLNISKNVINELQTKAAKITSATDQKGNKYYVKLITIEQSQQKGYSQCIEFNKQIFGDIQQFLFKQHLLDIKTQVNNGQMIGLVREPYQINLQKYIKNQKLSQKQVREIFSQVVKAIYSVLMNGYWHRNVRIEHFVKVKNLWKLQSLVLDEDYSQCQGQYNQYLWNPKYQPPQFDPKNKNYSDQDYNRMTVWNLGCILLQLLTIHHKLSSKQVMDKFQGKQFTMQAIGISTNVTKLISQQTKDLLASMLHHNPNKRMTLLALFQNPQISSEVSKHALKNKKIPQSKIVSGKSSIRGSKLDFQAQSALNQISKTIKQQQIIQKKQLQASKISLDEDSDFLTATLQQMSYRVQKKDLQFRPQPQKVNIHITPPPSEQDYTKKLNEIMNNKQHPVRKALQIYKSYYDQSQLLMLSSKQIMALDFKMFKNQPEISQIKFLNKYAIIFVSLINLNSLAQALNRNQNRLQIDPDLFINFQNSQQYDAFKKIINFKKNQRAKLLQQFKKQFMMTKNDKLIKKDPKVSQFLNKDYKKTAFPQIKTAYRFIVKFAYDAISQQYNRMRQMQQATNLAKIAMYVTYALTIDKLYIIEEIPDNFKYYFQWLKKEPAHYVPLSQFKRYIQQAPKDILIQNSRFILKKYYNI